MKLTKIQLYSFNNIPTSEIMNSAAKTDNEILNLQTAIKFLNKMPGMELRLHLTINKLKQTEELNSRMYQILKYREDEKSRYYRRNGSRVDAV